VSLETAIARIQEIQTALTPPSTQRSFAPPASPFATQLQDAMAPGASGAPAPAGAPGATPQAGAAPGQTFGRAAPGSYPHLDGDLDCNPELLRRLEALAAKTGQHFHITSGGRSRAEQQRLWDARGSNPYPVARPGTSRHESGNAADVTIGGRAIQTVISAADLRAAGIAPLAGDAVHVELPH
jgi:D-alanyl-D-alanine carboxypeptidase